MQKEYLSTKVNTEVCDHTLKAVLCGSYWKVTFRIEICEKSFSSKYACVMSCSFAWSNPYKGLEEKQTQKQVNKTI